MAPNTVPAFKITKNNIPEKGSIRSAYNTRERIETLMRRPPHKEGAGKFDPENMERTIAPLTCEDTS